MWGLPHSENTMKVTTIVKAFLIYATHLRSLHILNISEAFVISFLWSYRYISLINE